MDDMTPKVVIEEVVDEEQEPQVSRQQRKVLRDYIRPTVFGSTSSITRPLVQANNFELKPALI